MLFNSVDYIFFFLPVTLSVYIFTGKSLGHVASLCVLVIASFFFYGWWDSSYLWLLAGSIFVNYLTGYLISLRFLEKGQRRCLLAIGIIINLALIFYFKYAYFLIENLSFITGKKYAFSSAVLPLGISFFTFQQIAYLIDVYHEKINHSLIKYSLFICFFPQLIAGPIVHHRDVLPQFTNNTKTRLISQDLAVGLTIFVIGLVKKVLIADSVAKIANPAFATAAAGESPALIVAWSATLAYTLQLYFDFSGYSDMAIGAARLFGIRLPANFNSPYKATDISDFWRRWHITLSNFLRDYLYIPLGGNQKGESRRAVNLMITMLLGGLWHGAGWTFILWGGLHGVYLVINQNWRRLLKVLGQSPRNLPMWRRRLSGLLTFLAVMAGWVLFRSENIAAAGNMFRAMVVIDSGIGELPAVKTLAQILIALGIAWFLPNTQEWLKRYEPVLKHHMTESNTSEISKAVWSWKPSSSVGFTIGAVLFIAVRQLLQALESEFLYFNF